MSFLSDILTGVGFSCILIKIFLHWHILRKIDPEFIPSLGGNLMPAEYFLPIRENVPSTLRLEKKYCNILFWISITSFTILFIVALVQGIMSLSW
jgi:hypothetical protein